MKQKKVHRKRGKLVMCAVSGFCPRVPVHKNRYKKPNNVQQLNKGS